MAHYGLSSDVACRVAVKNPPHRNWKSSPPQLEIRRGLKCERLGIPIRLESDLFHPDKWAQICKTATRTHIALKRGAKSTTAPHLRPTNALPSLVHPRIS